ncbi:hypothetical protein OKW29_000161 [Paraburkholderia sp. CI3]
MRSVTLRCERNLAPLSNVTRSAEIPAPLLRRGGYAQDPAQLGFDADNGGIVLIVRIPFDDDVNGEWLADLLAHYAEHGRYWQKNILESTDGMFDGIATGQYMWICS